MNGLIPPTDPLGVPSPPIIFQALAWLTLSLHFVFMNYVLGGTLILTVNEWLFGGNAKVSQANYWMAKIMPVCLSLAITMGVAPLLFVQVLYGQFFYTANIMMGWYWMAILALVIFAFYMIYLMIALRPDDKRATIATRLIVLVNLCIFLTVALIFTNNATLTENPELWRAVAAGERSPLVNETHMWVRYLHNVTGALAVAGVWCAGIARFQLRYHSSKAESARFLFKNGLIWAKTGVLLASIIGFAYLGVMGIDRLKAFMGNGIMFVGWSVAVVLALASLVLLAMAMIKKDQPRFFWGSAVVMFLVLFGMVMGRDLLRAVSLEQYYTFADLTPNYEWTSLIMFVVTLVLGLLTLAYMIRLLWTIPGEPAQAGAAAVINPSPEASPDAPSAPEAPQMNEPDAGEQK